MKVSILYSSKTGNTRKLAYSIANELSDFEITITDITTDCGISRMAFYYHFKDIYDLVEWCCVEDGTKALQRYK